MRKRDRDELSDADYAKIVREKLGPGFTVHRTANKERLKQQAKNRPRPTFIPCTCKPEDRDTKPKAMTP